MTTVIEGNTFLGPNQGNSEGYIPQTTIESAVMDADMLQILHDLNYHLSLLQTIFNKLDQINLDDLNKMTAEEIVALINASTCKIDLDNLADEVISESELTTAFDSHCQTTVDAKMHMETSIKGTGLTYSNTPTSLLTVCNNLLDELKNIRYQIHRMNGKSVWVDTPDSSIAALKTALDTLSVNFSNHKINYNLHLTPNQSDAFDMAHEPSITNAVATMSDLASLGYGDMLKSIYDKNNNGVVDSSEALYDNGTLKTYQDIVLKIATDISTHRSNASAHHTRYTDGEAIYAINNDVDHDITAKHHYPNLLNKPPADAFLTTEVTNIRNNKLANGTTPWNDKIAPTNLTNVYIMPSAWNEANNVSTKAFFSNSASGEQNYTFTGPLILLGGTGYCTAEYGYLQVSVNGGSTWSNVILSPNMIWGPGAYGDVVKVWTCPIMYIPSGKTFKIRVGSTFCSCKTSNKYYGAGYHIFYKTV